MPTPTGGGTYSFVDFAGDLKIDALLVGTKWGGTEDTAAAVTYSFPGIASYWSTDPNLGYGPTSGEGEPIGSATAADAGWAVMLWVNDRFCYHFRRLGGVIWEIPVSISEAPSP